MSSTEQFCAGDLSHHGPSCLGPLHVHDEDSSSDVCVRIPPRGQSGPWEKHALSLASRRWGRSRQAAIQVGATHGRHNLKSAWRALRLGRRPALIGCADWWGAHQRFRLGADKQGWPRPDGGALWGRQAGPSRYETAAFPLWAVILISNCHSKAPPLPLQSLTQAGYYPLVGAHCGIS